jgi:hypothetical protein
MRGKLCSGPNEVTVNEDNRIQRTEAD